MIELVATSIALLALLATRTEGLEIIESAVVIDASVETQPLSEWTASSLASFDPKKPLQVIPKFLNDEELAHYNKLADQAQQSPELPLGILTNQVDLPPMLVQRFDCLWNEQRCAQGPRDESIQAKVTRFQTSVDPHVDYQGGHPTHGYTAVIPLQDFIEPFVWGENDATVPLRQGSLVVFHSNYTHSLKIEDGDEARFLGPFELEDFAAVGNVDPPGGCQACRLTCNTNTLTIGACSYEISINCDNAWTGELCFDCNAMDQFMFGYMQVQRRLQEGAPGAVISTPYGTCALPSEPTDFLKEFEVQCVDRQGNEAIIRIINTDYQSKSKGKGTGRSGRNSWLRQLDSMEDQEQERDHQHGRTLRRGKSKGKGSQLDELLCLIPEDGF